MLAASDSLPLLDYKDIPATLSSALEGRDMEAIKRTDPRIRQRDFIARMPLKYTSDGGIRKKAQSASSIGMKMTRFRQEHGMLSWVGREGSRTIRDALWSNLPQWNKTHNSIRGLKPPTELEKEKVREGNQGKFNKNAGRRALPESERARRRKKKEERRLGKQKEQQKREGQGEEEEEGEGKGKREAEGGEATSFETAVTRPNVGPSGRDSQRVDFQRAEDTATQVSCFSPKG